LSEKETDSDEDFQLETDKEESETGNHTDCTGSNTPSSSSPGGSAGSRRARGSSQINSLVLYKANNPDFAKKYMAHKIYRETLVLQLVQKLLDKRADPSSTAFSPERGRPTQDESRLKGKHFQTTSEKRKRCVVCGYQKSNGKYKDTKTYTYCAKCKKHICKNCFEDYYTRLVIKK
jgi:hypothetical protein